MATYEYDDFRVMFTPRPDGAYDVEATTPDGMVARAQFIQPLSDDDLRRAVETLGKTRSLTTRDIGTAVIDRRVTAEQLGAQLAGALLTGDIGTAYDAARDRAVAAGRGLRLRLSLAHAPALLNVPWEFMYLKPTFLASQRRTPIVRFLQTDSPVAPSRVDDHVRILGLIANPEGSQVLDVAAERAKVDMALGKVRRERSVDVDWLDPATPRRLRQTLQEGNYHILHFVGHSEYRDGEGVLFLEDDDHQMAQVSTSQFVNLLGDQATLRLVVLNSCEAARTDAIDPFAGLATSIVALGIPAVVAMQFEISDQAAITFAEELYHSLIARQDPIDAAVAEARKAVFTEVNEIEWATPVLFLRNDDGRLFSFAGPMPLPPPTGGRLRTGEIDAVTTVPTKDPLGAVDTTGEPTTVIEPVVPPLPPTGFWGRLRKIAKRKVGISIGGALVVAALVVGAIAIFGGKDDDSPEFVNAIAVTAPVTPRSSAADIRLVQFYLLRVGIPVGSSGVDGEFGSITASAVRTFQRSRSLDATGTVDAETAAQMSEWIGPRAKSNGLMVAVVDESDGTTHLYGLDTGGTVGLGTTAGGARDLDAAWNPDTNQVAFFRAASSGLQNINVIVPSSGNDPRGGADAGISVKAAVDAPGRHPVWTNPTTLAFVIDRANCTTTPACQAIQTAEVRTESDLIEAAVTSMGLLSDGWRDITAIAADPANEDRIAVIGTRPDDGRTGLWLVENEPVFVAGTEDAIDVAFSPDGSSLAVIRSNGTDPPTDTELATLTPGGSGSATTTALELAEASGGVLPGAAQLTAISAAPAGTGAAFVALVRHAAVGLALPRVLLLDAALRVVAVVEPIASILENDRNHLTPDEWFDIVDVAG